MQSVLVHCLSNLDVLDAVSIAMEQRSAFHGRRVVTAGSCGQVVICMRS